MKTGYSRKAIRCIEDMPQWSGGVIGIDEVGRGSVMGPVITCAVFMNSIESPECLKGLLGDSKKLNRTARIKAVEAINNAGLHYAFGAVSSSEVDRINVFRATMNAMTASLRKLRKQIQTDKPPLVLIDGPFLPELDGMQGVAVIKGDGLVPAIMAASILAKQFRDNMMMNMDRIYPDYRLKSNMGYGTAAHMMAIKEKGITRHHRMSFLQKHIK